MADHFVKLWASILDSSVWREPEAHRIVWIAMLAMADKNGFVGASVDGLARRANVSEEQAESALASFLAPDPRSRNQEHEGRRIQVVPRGWHIFNHGYFRGLQDREMLREYERARKAEQRRRVSSDVPDSTGQDRDTTGHSQECPPAYVYADSSAGTGTGESTREEPTAAQRKWAPRPDDVSEPVWQDWIAHRKALKALFSATALAQTRTEAGKADLTLEQALSTAMASGWRGFRAEYVRDRAPAKSGKGVIPKDLSKEDWGESGPI